MRGGDLDRLITITRRTLTKNAIGETTEVFAALYENVPAKVTPNTGNSHFVAAQRSSEVELVMNIRWIYGTAPAVPAVTALDRVLFDGRDYEILAVLEIGRREGIALNVRARAEPPGIE
ncbi:MAG: phage head closure protein [Bdellovibrionales bacterium]